LFTFLTPRNSPDQPLDLPVYAADLNPRPDGLDCPVYFLRKGSFPRWYLFSSPLPALAFEQMLWDLNTVDEAGAPALLRRVADEFPRGRQLFARLVRSRYDQAAPATHHTFDDPGAERLFAAYDALLPIGRVLIARARGDASAALTRDEVEVCE